MKFTEDDIRSDALMQDQAKFFAEDIEELLKHQREFVEVPCPACGSYSSKEDFIKYGMHYGVCQNCSTMYINPRPTPSLLEHYYANSKNYQYWNNFIFPASENVRRELIFRPRAERLIKICHRHNVKMGTLLEVGAGFGTFCEEIQKKNAFDKVVAVEPTPGLAETCRKKAVDVIQKPIEQVHFDERAVDVVVSFEVIEHLFSPNDFIRICNSVLSPGGLLILSCPNIKGFDIAVLKHLSDSVDIEHLNYFNPDSLSTLITSNGFEVLEITTPGQLDAELVRKKFFPMNIMSQINRS